MELVVGYYSSYVLWTIFITTLASLNYFCILLFNDRNFISAGKVNNKQKYCCICIHTYVCMKITTRAVVEVVVHAKRIVETNIKPPHLWACEAILELKLGFGFITSLLYIFSFRSYLHRVYAFYLRAALCTLLAFQRRALIHTNILLFIYFFFYSFGKLITLIFSF